MKISARNRVKGKIVDVKLGATTAHVRIDVGGSIITCVDHQRSGRRTRSGRRR
jgi:molybdopterin-binding protein